MDVLVVGAGPVGLTAAIELARYGLSVRIVDKAPQRSDKSKALAIWSRTLELMDRPGVSDALVAAGNKVDGTELRAGDTDLGSISLESVPSPYNFVLLVPQNETERVLEAHLNGLGVRVERGVELAGFADASDGVTTTLLTSDGRSETTTAAWLVACDGAHSPVRHALGKTFEGDMIVTEFVLADVHLAGAHVSTSEISMFGHNDGLLQLFPIHGDRFRVIADTGPAPATPRPEPTLADVQAILDRRGPGGIDAFDPIWLSSFRVNERKVDDYRSGRVFLAGDAAHVHSPAGGQGMNTGMQDACNLGWKLALIQHGTCAVEPLAQSYSAERSPVARAVLAESGRLNSLMTLENPTLQAVRNAAVRLLFGLAPVRAKLAETLSEISIGYPDSPLTHAACQPAHGPAAGRRAPLRDGEAPIGAGSVPRFALFAGANRDADDILRQFPDLVEPALRAPFHAGSLWLVRPDGYVSVVASDGRPIVDYLGALRRRGVGETDSSCDSLREWPTEQSSDRTVTLTNAG